MFNDITTNALVAAIRGGSARQQAIAQNIANADTPGYKAISVEFEGALASAIASDRSRMTSRALAMSKGEQWWDREPETDGFVRTAGRTEKVGAASGRDLDLTMRVDGSNVDPDQQMSELAANQIAYNTSNALLRARFGQFRAVIQGQ